MDRDGRRVSMWQEDMPAYTGRNLNLPSNIMQVAIIGGGITGLATALQLQKAGKRCVLIDSHNIGFGTSSGTTAHINTLLDTSYYQIENKFDKNISKLVYRAAKAAVNTIEENVREYKIDCDFQYKDAYLFAKDNKQAEELDSIMVASANAGLKISETIRLPLNIPFKKAAIINEQAQFHPTKYIYKLANAFEEAGGVIVQNCMFKSFETDKIVKIKTTKGDLYSKNLVFATHIPPGVNLLHFRCSPYRSYVIAVQLNGTKYPDDLIYDMDEPYHYYRTQNFEHQQYLIFGGEDHKTGHEENAEYHFVKLENYLETHFDIREVSYRWSSQFYEPNDGLAYIGRLPGYNENVFVATGFSGNGMTYSHIAAKLLSEMIITGSSTFEKVFDPGRIKPVAAFTNFVKENADVVKEFISKRISKDKIDTLSEISNGEGKVVKYDDDSIGVYKSENGIIYAVDPACTHVNCMVQWNNAEKSWDCPCHGARYSFKGEVLNAPSTMKLNEINLQDEKVNAKTEHRPKETGLGADDSMPVHRGSD